jgi:two-component system, OmpR family, alkaline phosphatase synthesis response regulator PhoP
MRPARRILLIEDEDDIREIATLSLESIGGWIAISASSGKEGIIKAQSEKPDAILLDVMMPDMDGPATLQALRNAPETKDIPVIFMTAKVQAPERRKLEDLGAQGLIPKPFDPTRLSKDIAGALGWEH